MQHIYKITPAAECGRVITDVFTGSPYKRVVPKVFGPRADWVMNTLSKEIERTVIPPSFSILEFHDVTIVGGGIVLTKDKKVVEESLVHVRNSERFHGFLKSSDAPGGLLWEAGEIEVKRVASPGLFLHAGQTYDGNYGHWLVDIVPRVALAASSLDVSSATALLYPASDPMIQVFKDSLVAYSVVNSQLWDGNIQIPSLVYPTQLTDGAFTKSPIIVDVLENLGRRLIGDEIGNSIRIFVLRPPNARRKLVNTAEICEIAHRKGYMPVEPWHMSLSAQAKIFSGAQKIIGVLGAELTNLAFARSNCDLFGLSPATMHDDFYWDLVSLKGGQYFSLHGDPENPAMGMNSPFSIDPSMFAHILDEFDNIN